MKLAVIVDGEKTTDMPTSPVGKDGKYYDVQVSCTSSKTSGLWDYNAWRLNLDYIESNSKCNLTFTSSMNKEEYDKYIQAGVALRRNTYRGKDITEYFTGTKKVNGRDLFQQIENGTFDDIYVGDYIISENLDSSSKKIVWLIADLDNYLKQGNYGDTLTKHHATIIPSYALQNSRMNPEPNSTDKGASQIPEAAEFGAYKGSEMYQVTLNAVLSKYIEPDFCKSDLDCHIIEYRNLVSNAMDANRTNQYGGVYNGASSNWSWETRKLDLMSEVNVYGTTVWSSSGHDIGIDNRQYAIFQLRPELINQTMSGSRYSYWLKAVTGSASFARVSANGEALASHTSISDGVRPRFLID